MPASRGRPGAISFQLDDLRNGPGELTNRAGASKLAEMKSELTRRLRDELIVTQNGVPPEQREALQPSRWRE